MLLASKCFKDLLVLIGTVAAIQTALVSPKIAVRSDWEVLGPLQSGTREQQWGADPLESYGGFRNIAFDDSREFPSTLNGSVRFSRIQGEATGADTVTCIVPVVFNDVDWHALQSTFGWSALQFQAWIRGTITVQDDGRYGIWIGSAVEFYLDGKYYDVGNLYEGDIVQFSRGGLFLDLSPGDHTIEIRVVNDVRAFGGRVPPKVEVQLALRQVSEELVVEGHDGHGGWEVPQVINMTRKNALDESMCIAGEWASFALRNEGRHPVVISSLKVNEGPSQLKDEIDFIRLAPGQQRPIRFKVSGIGQSGRASVQIEYRRGKEWSIHTKNFCHQLPVVQNITTPHQFTYLHPSGIVTSGIIKPPKDIASGKVAYLIFALHGAGVENNSIFWSKYAYRELDDVNAYIIQPSGVTPWGDDWHGAWSLPDVDNLRMAVHLWSIAVSPCLGRGLHFLFWVPAIVAGHSNGGQGAWYALTHWSDASLWAGNPISGYSSIQAYVPYTFWQPLEAKVSLIKDIALRSYDHAMLAINAVPFPIHVRHGSADDNVPVWHTRRLVEKVRQAGGNISFDEVPGAGHWFDNIMTGGSVGDFLRNMTSEYPFHRPTAHRFLVANPREMGSRGGIKVEQLLSPVAIGEIEVERRLMSPIPLEVLHINTSNIRRFRVMDPFTLDVIHVDGQYVPCGERLCWSFVRNEFGRWINEDIIGLTPEGPGPIWKTRERYGRQLGPLAAIMDSPGRFTIVIGTLDEKSHSHFDRVASRIAQNLFVYFGAEVDIRYDFEVGDAVLDGNVISLGTVDQNTYFQQISRPPHLINPFPIHTGKGQMEVRDSKMFHYYEGGGIGAIYLHPLERGRLALIVCGTDEEGLERAARLFPYRTGVGQPDWIIVGPKMGVDGMQGAEAMGYFSNLWEIEEFVSYFST